MDARNVSEAVGQLDQALANFNRANRFYNRLFSKQSVKEAWENLRKHCQQLSGWIEYGVAEEMKPDLVKKLFAAEKVLSVWQKYSRYGRI